MKRSRVEKCIRMICLIASLVTIVLGSAFYVRKENFEAYNREIQYIKEGNNSKALESFQEISNYTRFKDVPEILEQARFKVCPHCGNVIEEEN